MRTWRTLYPRRTRYLHAPDAISIHSDSPGEPRIRAFRPGIESSADKVTAASKIDRTKLVSKFGIFSHFLYFRRGTKYKTYFVVVVSLNFCSLFILCSVQKTPLTKLIKKDNQKLLYKSKHI